MRCGETLLVDEDANEELAGWRDVLEKPQGGESDAFGSLAIEQQGYGGDCAGHYKKNPCAQIEAVQCRLTVANQESDVNQCCRHHPQSLDSEGCGGVELHLLFEETVDSKTEGKCQRYDREMSVVDSEIEHSGQCQDECNSLGSVEPFAEEDEAKQNVDEWVDIVSQAALENVAVVYCPDVETPVEGYQCSGDKQHQVLFFFSDVLVESHVADDDEEHNHEHGRPEHAVSQDFEAVDMLQQTPIEREETPDGVAEKTVYETFFVHSRHFSFVARGG